MTVWEMIEMLQCAPHASKVYLQADGNNVYATKLLILPESEGAETLAVFISGTPEK